MKKVTGFQLLVFVLFCCSYIFGIEPEITSKILEFRRNENKIIFKDNVNMKHGNNILSADTAIKDEKNSVIELFENVKCHYFFKNSTDTIEVVAKYGKWDLNKEEIELTGRPWVLYTSSGGQKVEIESEKIVLDEKTDSARFYDNIILRHRNSVAMSELAEYEHKDGRIILFAKDDIMPNFDYSNGHKGKFVAEKITLLPEEERLILEEKVNLKILE